MLVLLVIAYLVNQQLGAGSRAPDPLLERDLNPSAPQVPTAPGDVEQFGQDMQEYLNEQAEKQAEAIRKAEEG
ncbi:MAG: hypothetical protein AAGA23_00750 [Pseudomonadota bacterium]